MSEQGKERAYRSLLGLPVWDRQEGQPLGRIRGLLLNEEARQGLALLVERRRGNSREERILPWPAIIAWEKAGPQTEGPGRLEKKGQSAAYIRALRQPQALLGARVFSNAGHSLGQVWDYTIDLANGKLTGLTLQAFSGKKPIGPERFLPAKMIIASSQRTIMVWEPPAETEEQELTDEKRLPQDNDEP